MRPSGQVREVTLLFKMLMRGHLGEEPVKKLRILIADDSHFMRIALKKILETQEDFEVIGLAADGEQALGQAIQLAPDVAILDIRMPKLDGLEAARRITGRHPGTAIVIISAFDDLAFLAELVRDGPQGKAYLLKSSLDDIGQLIHTVKSVAKGHTILDPNMVHKLARLYDRESHKLPVQLSETELDVLELMAEGYEDSAIAVYLRMERRTFDAEIESMYRKLGLSERDEWDRRIEAVQSFVGQVNLLISGIGSEPNYTPLSDVQTR